ncbi:MAG: Methanol oxidation protein, partial [Akkermansiaceae bacterium]|nr:Methanol oxidation protein [Akkermansiaceae bacterium]
WLLESMLLHDTYASEGHQAFPGLPFYGPPGFSEVVKFETLSLESPPAEWEGQIKIIALEGAPKLKEYAVIHLPTRTLIVADLSFNFRPDEQGWDRFFHRYIAGFKRYPGMSRIFKWCVTDPEAFKASIHRLLDEDFDRIIVGHGRTIPTGGKDALRGAMRDVALI